MGKIKQLKEAVKDYFDENVSQDVRDRAAMRIRTDPRILKRWMGYTGATRPEDIDYADPCVQIEWWGADMSLLAIAEDADRFIAETGCDRDVYMRYYWPKAIGEP